MAGPCAGHWAFCAARCPPDHPLAPDTALSSTGINQEPAAAIAAATWRIAAMAMQTPIHPPIMLAAALALGAGPAFAQGLEDKLVIVTSFSKDLTTPFAQAFQKKYPGTKVEVQNRNTAAAIAFIRETQSSPPDIFWASAPDAFEVLKKHSLLQNYKPRRRASPARSAPIRSTTRPASIPASPPPATASCTTRATCARTTCRRRRNGTTSRSRSTSATSASRRRRAPAPRT